MASEKTTCSKCSTSIQPITAKLYDGMCVPCATRDEEWEKQVADAVAKQNAAARPYDAAEEARIEAEFRSHVKNSNYKDILLPHEPYENGEPSFYSQYTPLTEDILNQFQALYGMKLPEDIAQLLIYRNGGELHDYALKEECLFGAVSAITMDISGKRWQFAMIPLFNWLDSRGDFDEIEGLRKHADTLKRLLIIDGDGHYFHCLDYRKGETSNGVVHVELEGGFEVSQLCKQFKNLFNYWK